MSRHHHEPVVGSWYDSGNFPQSFVVLDCEKDEYVDIQYLDGELDKIDIDTWDALDPEEIEQPEEATAPYGVDREDDVIKLLNEIEEQKDLDTHLRHIDSDEENWD